MKTKLCLACQEENPLNALVCRNCGSSFTGSQTLRIEDNHVPDERVTEITRSSTDTIVLMVDNFEAPVIVKEKDFILGRHVPGYDAPNVDLNIFGGGVRGVSRLHAQVQRNVIGYVIRDLHSTNGTMLNGSRLVPETFYALHNGDKLTLGKLPVTVYFSALTEERTIFIADTAEHQTLLSSRQKLSAHHLTTTVGVFLRALADLQKVLDDIQAREHVEVGISSISVSPGTLLINVQLEGGSDAVDWIQHKIIPWKHQQKASGIIPDLPHAQQLALALAEAFDLAEDDRYTAAQRLIPLVQALAFSTLEIVDKPES